MNILFDDRWQGNNGIATFNREVVARLGEVTSVAPQIKPLHPLDPLWITAEIAKHRPNVYFSPGFNPPLYSRSPYVFTIHDLNHLQAFDSTSYLKRLYYQLVMKPACHRAWAVLTGSEYSKNEVIRWSGITSEKIVNVGYAAGPQFYQCADKFEPGFPYLFYIGNRKSHKNVQRMLAGFAQSQLPSEVKLVMSGELDRQMQGWLREYSLESEVVFLGAISQGMLPSVYRGALATVLVSLYEGFGLPILESMACGTAVITSNITACPEVAGAAGKLVDPYSVTQIADAMSQVVADQTMRNELASLGLERASMFSWDKTVAQVKAVLEDAMNQRRT